MYAPGVARLLADADTPRSEFASERSQPSPRRGAPSHSLSDYSTHDRHDRDLPPRLRHRNTISNCSLFVVIKTGVDRWVDRKLRVLGCIEERSSSKSSKHLQAVQAVVSFLPIVRSLFSLRSCSHFVVHSYPLLRPPAVPFILHYTTCAVLPLVYPHGVVFSYGRVAGILAILCYRLPSSRCITVANRRPSPTVLSTTPPISILFFLFFPSIRALINNIHTHTPPRSSPTVPSSPVLVTPTYPTHNISVSASDVYSLNPAELAVERSLARTPYKV